MNQVETGEKVETSRTLLARAGKYLTFRLAEEAYGLSIMKVQEIIGMMKITRVPRVPAFIRGVVNLRGRVIPVVDLRLKFGLEQIESTERTCIIVLQIKKGDQEITVGVLVDEVSEVMDLIDDQVEPPPTFGTQVNAGFLIGVGKVEEKVLMLLDIDKVLTTDEMTNMKKVGEPKEGKA